MLGQQLVAFGRWAATRLEALLQPLLIVVIVPAVLIAWSLGYLPLRWFNATDWREAAASNDGTRISMVNALMWSGRLDGASRSSVLDQLGPPHDGPYFRDRDLVYYLGDERGLMGIDSEWLVIDFDRDGKVASHAVVSD